ncbi:MAG: hypothetical protein JWQ72_3369 [Polaromonas sp.]|nr:hypothetical protein [Polaromonas sp.]
MSNGPAAALALWNDVAAARDDEYEHWHAVEHVPERDWAPGFIAATRYADRLGQGPRYFTLYELDTLAALGTPQYLELVQRPTPWSASMRPSMSHFVRKPLAVAAWAGDRPRGTAAGVITLRAVWDTAPADWGPRLVVMAARLRAAAPDVRRVAGGWVCDSGPQAIANLQDAPAGAEAIVWAELEGEVAATDLGDRLALLRHEVETTWSAPLWQLGGGYGAITHVPRTYPADAPRPRPRTDLMAGYRS